MRPVAATLAAHLSGEATTLATAWRVTRRDGIVLGFTDHDRDLVFLDTRFLAASGFSASAAEAELGLAAATSDLAGAFSSRALTEADLIAGRYDGARVEVFRVNWQDPDQHLLLRVQAIGEVRREADRFSAELRSVTARLSQSQGRIFARRCDAQLGDTRCGVDLSLDSRRMTASLMTMAARDQLIVSGVGDQATDHFRHGTVTVTDGPEAGQTAAIEASRREDAVTRISLWLPLPVSLAAGTGLTLEIGCDKSFATCRDTFANALNFRGFPHMPGADFAYSYVRGQTTHDGGVLFE